MSLTFFANYCSLISSELKLLTEHTLTSCGFSETDIHLVIDSQDSNNVYGDDMIRICMLRV